MHRGGDEADLGVASPRSACPCVRPEPGTGWERGPPAQVIGASFGFEGVGPPKGPQQRAWRRELAMLVASAQAHDRAKTAASEVSPAPPRRERLADQGLEAASARAGWGGG